MAVAWPEVSAAVGRLLGLHYPRERMSDLRRGLKGAALELGFVDAEDLARAVQSPQPDPAVVEAIASHLAIGETYFFRGEDTFAALARGVLPELVAERRRRGDLQLRIWSAACCTGEETYSLAILLHQLVPDLAEWRITLLGTDIHPGFLRKAREAAYGQWSFRGMPAAIRDRYFEPLPKGRFAVRPEIRRMARFSTLNLIDGVPSLARHGPFDLVLCRNVLMYFAAGHAARVVSSLHSVIGEHGWLVVAPCETPRLQDALFDLVQCDGALLHRRIARRSPRQVAGRVASRALPAPVRLPTVPARAQPTPLSRRRPAFASSPAPGPGPAIAGASLAEARALADQRRMPEALVCCDRHLAREKLDAEAHYLRGVILAETGDIAAACTALERCIYLTPDHAMAGYALADLERTRGRGLQANRHCVHLLRILDRMPSDTPIEHAEGVNAGQLAVLANDLMQRIGGAAA